MAGIFICYRREDAPDAAGRLYDRLNAHFGKDTIFMDVDTVGLGEDFVEIIEDRVGSCEAFIAVIGPQWLKSLKRHTKAPNDFVRIEIAAALNRNIRLIPMLVNGAPMPRSLDLPEDIRKLARRNALEVPYAQFHERVDHLIEGLTSIIAGAAVQRAEENKIVSSLVPTPAPVIASPNTSDGYWVYVSYARSELENSMKRFFQDLVDEVRRRGGLQRERVAFVDESAIELGDIWNDSQSEAMRTCRTAVCLYSPTYFNSLNCAREFEVLIERQSAWASAGLAGSPPAVLPVIWTPFPGSAPGKFSDIQWHWGEFPVSYGEMGLRYLTKLTKFHDDYASFVMRLAERIVTAGRDTPLPALASLPPMSLSYTSHHIPVRSVPLETGIANPESPSKPFRVFLSHSSADRPRVRELYARLQADGFEPWMDEEKLMAGEDWYSGIAKAVRDSDVVLICLSRYSINREGYIHKEIRFALDAAAERPEGEVFLIPVRLEPTEIPERLRVYQAVDVFGNGYEELIRALKKASAQRPYVM